MNDKLQKIISQTIEKISEVIVPQKIILFGSANSKNFSRDSDIDWLVIVPKGTDKRKVTQQIYKAILPIGFATDIILITEDEFKDYKGSDAFIIKSIVENGTVLYG